MPHGSKAWNLDLSSPWQPSSRCARIEFKGMGTLALDVHISPNPIVHIFSSKTKMIINLWVINSGGSEIKLDGLTPFKVVTTILHATHDETWASKHTVSALAGSCMTIDEHVKKESIFSCQSNINLGGRVDQWLGAPINHASQNIWWWPNKHNWRRMI